MSTIVTRLNLLLPSVFVNQFKEHGFCQLSDKHLADKSEFSIKISTIKVSEDHLILDLSIAWRQLPNGSFVKYSAADKAQVNIVWGFNSFRTNIKLPKSHFSPEELDKLLRIVDINSKKEFKERLQPWGHLKSGTKLNFKPVSDFCQFKPKGKDGSDLQPYYLLQDIDLSNIEWQGLGMAVAQGTGVVGTTADISSDIDAAFGVSVASNLPVPDSTMVPQTDGAVF